MNGLLSRARSLWRGLRRPGRLEAEMDEEMRFHIEMEAERLMRERGLGPAEARRRAAAAFGGVDKYKEAGRDARGITRVTGMALDFKLGLRMLARYPGLTVVGGLAMAFGIAVGAGAFQLSRELNTLPLAYADADRIVTLQNVSTETTFPEPRALHDFAAWRGELRSVDHLSALSLRERSLSAAAGPASPVTEVAISVEAFRLVPPPLLGRPLVAEDEAPGAPAVAVLGHALWKRRFGGDAGVVGRVVRLGGEPATVVGVMPEDFAFFVPREGFTTPPEQDLWVPFRLSPFDHPQGGGPAVTVFGRLAPGATLADARAELAAVAARRAEAWPATHARLKTEVLTFRQPLIAGRGSAAAGMVTLTAVFLVALMGVLCANVALLLFARAAAREGELAVRSALGASRGRIVFQLFAEALVLAGASIALGLAGAQAGLRWAVGVLDALMRAQGRPLPSWIDGDLSPSTIGYAVALALTGAAVAGVLPGLGVTGRRARTHLQRLAGRGSGVRMGRVWTVIIVAQVALTVTLVPVAVALGRQTLELKGADLGLPAGDYLSVRLEMEGDEGYADPDDPRWSGGLARYRAGIRALERRVAAEPGVAGVTFAQRLPGSPHPRPAVEVEGAGGLALPAANDGQAQTAAVDPGFFGVMGAPILAGRGFTPADAAADARVVVVNESFARELLGGRSAVGRRLRYGKSADGGPAPWHEVVGVVRDLGMGIDPFLPHNAGVYRPLVPGETYPVRMAVRVSGEPGALTGRLLEVAAGAAPGVEVHRPQPMDHAARGLLVAQDAWFRVIVLAGAMALLLANAGIYAILSFTVSRRTREIGVRVALGADRRRIVSAILSRTARHVGAGVLAGALLGLFLAFALSEGAWRPSALQGGGLLAAYVAVMSAVCMLAAIVPTRRALRIEPMEALNADG